jgi:hypothetical protein
MRRTLTVAVLTFLGLAAWSVDRFANGCGDVALLLNGAAKNAIAEDPKVSEPAIRLLRAHGPTGLQALLAAHDETIKKHAEAAAHLSSFSPPKKTADGDDVAWQRLRTALDEVSGQRDCHASRLFWYTDFDQAKAAAKREGKPILSLRLLGKLTDEYSCANSRFFRTTLYSNAEISKVLGDRFILHWKSVRPVPKVTIDFGDGRKLERTLTGNSIHYVLDSDGRVIDALPGLYGPKAFLRELDRAEQTAKQAAGKSEGDRAAFLAQYHRERAAAITEAWQQDLTTLGIAVPVASARPYGELPAYVATAAQPTAVAAVSNLKSPPSAVAAGARAIGKGFVEMPIIKKAALAQDEALTKATTDDVWSRIARLHAADSQLDPASVALIRSQHPTAVMAARLAYSKMAVEDPLVKMVRNFQGAISLDTVRNEYTFHRQIHEWLAAGPVPEIDPLNERVYAQLFLTPSSDPWLGLMPADTYTALEDNGVKQASSE